MAKMTVLQTEAHQQPKSYGLRPVVSDHESYRRWVDTSNIPEMNHFDCMGACGNDGECSDNDCDDYIYNNSNTAWSDGLIKATRAN